MKELMEGFKRYLKEAEEAPAAGDEDGEVPFYCSGVM